jgi:hypothetical protein
MVHAKLTEVFPLPFLIKLLVLCAVKAAAHADCWCWTFDEFEQHSSNKKELASDDLIMQFSLQFPHFQNGARTSRTVFAEPAFMSASAPLCASRQSCT